MFNAGDKVIVVRLDETDPEEFLGMEVTVGSAYDGLKGTVNVLGGSVGFVFPWQIEHRDKAKLFYPGDRVVGQLQRVVGGVAPKRVSCVVTNSTPVGGTVSCLDLATGMRHTIPLMDLKLVERPRRVPDASMYPGRWCSMLIHRDHLPSGHPVRLVRDHGDESGDFAVQMRDGGWRIMVLPFNELCVLNVVAWDRAALEVSYVQYTREQAKDIQAAASEPTPTMPVTPAPLVLNYAEQKTADRAAVDMFVGDEKVVNRLADGWTLPVTIEEPRLPSKKRYAPLTVHTGSEWEF